MDSLTSSSGKIGSQNMDIQKPYAKQKERGPLSVSLPGDFVHSDFTYLKSTIPPLALLTTS